MTAARVGRSVASLAAALLAVAAGATVANGQEGLVFGRPEKTPPFALREWRGVLDLLMSRHVETVTPVRGRAATTTETLFRESLGLSATGHVIHPNLVELHLAGTLGLMQEFLTSPDQSDRVSGTVTEYDVSAVILRKEKAPLTLYARRSDDVVSRQFGGSYHSINATQGARWDIRDNRFPTWLEAYRQVQEQISAGGDQGGGNYQIGQNVMEWHSEARLSDHNIFSWDFKTRDVSQASSAVVGGQTQFQATDAALGHVLGFGPEHGHLLRSSVNVFRQAGFSPLERLRWDESLQLQHTPRFRTHYRYSLDDQTRLDVAQTQQRAAAGFVHQLYESLTTTANAGVLRFDHGRDARTEERFGDIGWAYRKKVPYGRLELSADLSAHVQENTERTVPLVFTDESHRFVDPDPVVLNQRNINKGSIFITDATGLVVYAEGPDYTLSAFANRVEIRRTLGGAIADGDTVLIDYSVSREPANTTTTQMRAFGERYSILEGPLRGLSLYARQTWQQQDIEPALTEAAFAPDEVVGRVFGIDYQVWKLTLNAERELYESAISPFNATRFSGSFSHRTSDGARIGLHAAQSTIDHLDDGSQSSFASLSGRFEKQLTRTLFGQAEVEWRGEQDRFAGQSDALEGRVELRWKYRQTQVFVMFRNVLRTTSGEQTNSQSIQIGIRRDF